MPDARQDIKDGQNLVVYAVRPQSTANTQDDDDSKRVHDGVPRVERKRNTSPVYSVRALIAALIVTDISHAHVSDRGHDEEIRQHDCRGQACLRSRSRRIFLVGWRGE